LTINGKQTQQQTLKTAVRNALVCLPYASDKNYEDKSSQYCHT